MCFVSATRSSRRKLKEMACPVPYAVAIHQKCHLGPHSRHPSKLQPRLEISSQFEYTWEDDLWRKPKPHELQTENKAIYEDLEEANVLHCNGGPAQRVEVLTIKLPPSMVSSTLLQSDSVVLHRRTQFMRMAWITHSPAGHYFSHNPFAVRIDQDFSLTTPRDLPKLLHRFSIAKTHPYLDPHEAGMPRIYLRSRKMPHAPYSLAACKGKI